MKTAGQWENVLIHGCFITSDVGESIKQVASLLAYREREAYADGMLDGRTNRPTDKQIKFVRQGAGGPYDE